MSPSDEALSGTEFDELVAPWKDLQPPQPMPEEAEIIKRLEADVEAADALGPDARAAVVGLIVAVGNYEWLSYKRPGVIAKANHLLAKYDPEHSWRWG